MFNSKVLEAARLSSRKDLLRKACTNSVIFKSDQNTRVVTPKAKKVKKRKRSSSSEDDAHKVYSPVINKETNQLSTPIASSTVIGDDLLTSRHTSSPSSSSDEEHENFNKTASKSVERNEKKNASNLLTSFESNLSKYKKLSSDDMPGLNIDSDDEIYLMHLPKNLDPQLLTDTKILTQQKCFVHTNDCKYDVKPFKAASNLHLFDSTSKKFNLYHINPKCTLTMNEHLKRKIIPVFDLTKSNSAPEFPPNLKVRHPLFGSNYEEKVNLSDELKKRLKVKKKRHEKKKRERSANEEIFEVLETKHKKKKHRAK